MDAQRERDLRLVAVSLALAMKAAWKPSDRRLGAEGARQLAMPDCLVGRICILLLALGPVRGERGRPTERTTVMADLPASVRGVA